MPSTFDHYKPTEAPPFHESFMVFYGPIPKDEICKITAKLDVFDVRRDNRGGTLFFRYTDYDEVLAVRDRLDAWQHEHEAQELAAGNARIDKWLADYRAEHADDLDIIEIPYSYWKDGVKHEYMQKVRVGPDGQTSVDKPMRG